ncbi:MAG: hypothetical protein HC836_38780 [Richelia sp. RM2_1_2]|nr:hypothetical protein [Richelia sp. RM1_1_1]NJO63919.1 hypothetical protein [Richelia sp. RM2_1_2]
MLEYEIFEKGLSLLAGTFGNFHGVHNDLDIRNLWFAVVANYEPERFLKLIGYYCSYAEKHPVNFAQILKFWNDRQPAPGEDYKSNFALPALPSSEINVAAMRPDLMAENLERMRLIIKIAFTWEKGMPLLDREKKTKELRAMKIEELRAKMTVYRNLKRGVVPSLDLSGNLKAPLDAQFEDMHKYFHSGSERYRVAAINWISKHEAEGYKFVRRDGEIVDIAEPNF